MAHKFVAGDTGSKLQVTCTTPAGVAINLTGAVVQLRWRDKGDSATVEKTMTVTNAVGGVCEYQFGPAELYAPQMKFEVKITDGTGKVLRNLTLLFEEVREGMT